MSQEQDLKEKEIPENEEHFAESESENLENQENIEHQQDEEAAQDEDPRDEMQRQLDEMKDQKLRLFAEFENFRKRTAKERIELYGTANRELMEALLPVLDDFKRAMNSSEINTEDEGIQLIYNKLENILKNKGLRPMEDTTGKEFDVETMEAVTRIPAPSKKLKGKVVDEIERGYELGGKILRYAKVVVGE